MKYRLKAGCKHIHFVKGEGHRPLTPGEAVELTDAQAKAFGDRFEPVGAGLRAESAPESASKGDDSQEGPGEPQKSGEPGKGDGAPNGGSAKTSEKGKGSGKKG